LLTTMRAEETVLKNFIKKSVPEIHPGDVVRVHQKIKEGKRERIQIFEGIVIAVHRKRSLDATFTVRRIVSGVGVERIFPLHSPNIVKIDFLKGSRVRRAKLYYLRGLSGKALKMKEKHIDKKVWEMLLPEKEKPVAAKAPAESEKEKEPESLQKEIKPSEQKKELKETKEEVKNEKPQKESKEDLEKPAS